MAHDKAGLSRISPSLGCLALCSVRTHVLPHTVAHMSLRDNVARQPHREHVYVSNAADSQLHMRAVLLRVATRSYALASTPFESFSPIVLFPFVAISQRSSIKKRFLEILRNKNSSYFELHSCILAFCNLRVECLMKVEFVLD